MIAASAMAPTQAVYVDFNRPYLMLISAPATGEPLFLARVDDPRAS